MAAKGRAFGCGLRLLGASLWLATTIAVSVHAQDGPAAATSAPIAANSTASSSTVASEIDVSRLKMPDLVFTASPEDERDFDKFFYFHREGTSYAEAYADVKECDALASGIRFYSGSNSAAMAGAMAQYGVLGGALGSAIGNAIADAIFGSAERRKARRINLRNCMNFKDYSRYGLSHDLWDRFNFEEGSGRKQESVREQALRLQALVASGQKPSTKELGL